MRMTIALAALAVAACSSPARDAEDQYNLTSPLSDDRCAMARKVKEEWLKKKDEGQYMAWQIQEQEDCSPYRFDRFEPANTSSPSGLLNELAR